MKQEVIRELSTAEIVERLEEERKQLIKLKLNHAISPIENPKKISSYRKTVARLLTELKSRELNKQLGEEVKKAEKELNKEKKQFNTQWKKENYEKKKLDSLLAIK